MKMLQTVVIVAICVGAYWWWSQSSPTTPESATKQPDPIAVNPVVATAAVVAPEPSTAARTVTYTEADINQRLASFAMEGAEITQVSLLQDEIVMSFSVAGLSSDLHMGVQALDGRVEIANPRIEGLLGSMIPVEQVVDGIEREINQRIVEQSPIRAIAVVPGAIEVTYSE
jgi:hypothetical protein